MVRRPTLAPLALLALLALAAASPRRLDQDFEFDDAPEAPRRARRFVFDPDSPLCRTLRCAPRELCVLRDSSTALCADKKQLLRRGDALLPGAASAERADDEDVFYEARPLAPRDSPDRGADRQPERAPDRCVGCGGARGGFLCGSDNRTYSSLCRLDLHNCVRRAAPPVRLACRGFCPCRAREERRRRRPESQNEVASHGRRGSPGSRCALEQLADRLLDWFGVLMADAGGSPPPHAGFPRDCQPEVRWMFAHLDAAHDGRLSRSDLYALRHDERERCLRPFLSRCGAARGLSPGLSRADWCACLRRAARPCAALARAHPAPPPGAYVPACDARGWYRPRQCHAALGVCWCVDPHGVERPGSRTKGAPLCPGDGEAEAARGAPADDEDAAGSGDNELRF